MGKCCLLSCQFSAENEKRQMSPSSHSHSCLTPKTMESSSHILTHCGSMREIKLVSQPTTVGDGGHWAICGPPSRQEVSEKEEIRLTGIGFRMHIQLVSR